MIETLLGQSSKVDYLINLNFNRFSVDQYNFIDSLGKSFSRSSGTSKIVQDSEQGNVLKLNGDGYIAGSMADKVLTGKNVEFDCVLCPTLQPPNSSSFQSLFEMGSSRTTGYPGPLCCYNSDQLELWSTAANNASQKLALSGAMPKVWQRINMKMYATGRSILSRYDMDGKLIGSITGTIPAPASSNKISIGGSYVLSDRFMLTGLMKSLTLKVISA